MLLNAITLSIIRQEGHWEIYQYKYQYSGMSGSDITRWFALLPSTDFAFSEKFVILSLFS